VEDRDKGLHSKRSARVAGGGTGVAVGTGVVAGEERGTNLGRKDTTLLERGGNYRGGGPS
jgi:hypothetical protein